VPHSERYSTTAIVLHWLIALAVIVQFTLGWAMQAIPKQPPGLRADTFNLHKSIGLTILAFMVVRLLWRWWHPAPVLQAMPVWQKRVALSNHALLYVALLVQPVAGYLGSVYSGYPVKLYGMTLPAWGYKDVALKDLCSSVHLATSWVLAGAVLLHIAGALKHALVDRDGTLARMGVGRARMQGDSKVAT
jgi:cytochrome b561